MNILLIGSSGQLGTELKSALFFNHSVECPTRKDLNLADRNSITSFFNLNHKNMKFDFIINCAAVHDLKYCEEHPDEALSTNANAMYDLSLIALRYDTPLMYISTDYVFDGSIFTRYTPYASPNPLSVYGKSKLIGELYLKSICKRYFIVRTAGLFGATPLRGKKENFVDMLVRRIQNDEDIDVKHDEQSSFTYAVDLANEIAKLIESDKYGIYHIVNDGGGSWYNYACLIARTIGFNAYKIGRISRKDFGDSALRPKNSILASSVDNMPTIGDAIERYAKEKGYENLPKK